VPLQSLHIRNSPISTQSQSLTCVPPSLVLEDANRRKRAREMVQFGRWTLCRSDDHSARPVTFGACACALSLLSVAIQYGWTVALKFYIFDIGINIIVSLYRDQIAVP
jgi:hypothetical protein